MVCLLDAHDCNRSSAVLRRLFTERDLEKDGILNSEELEQCLQIVGFCPTPADIEFLTKHFDTNGDLSLFSFHSILLNNIITACEIDLRAHDRFHSAACVQCVSVSMLCCVEHTYHFKLLFR